MGKAKCILEDFCPRRHVVVAGNEPHPDDMKVRVEKAVRFSLTMKDELGKDVIPWRKERLLEVEVMMEEQREAEWDWFARLPPHGKEAYGVPEARYGCVAWQSLKQLGIIIGYPGIENLYAEASEASVSWEKISRAKAGGA